MIEVVIINFFSRNFEVTELNVPDFGTGRDLALLPLLALLSRLWHQNQAGGLSCYMKSMVWATCALRGLEMPVAQGFTCLPKFLLSKSV